MAKVPVQKQVMRDGKLHTQTYWEESNPQQARSNTLANLGVSLVGQYGTKVADDPVRKAWNNSTLVSSEAVRRGDEQVEACIAAGLTPEAALFLQRKLSPGQTITDYIYDNGLDQEPRPRNGWNNAFASDDQRASWLRSAEQDGYSLEQAVEWIDAGFPFPWSGIPSLIKKGVSPERAMEWEADVQKEYRGSGSIGGSLYLYEHELVSDISLEEAKEWRKHMSSDNRHLPMDERTLRFRSLGFAPDEAARWQNVMYVSTPAQSAAELKSLGWSPSSVKAAVKELSKYSREKSLIGEDYAQELIYATRELGSPKVVKAWVSTVHFAWDDGFMAPGAIKTVADTEAWRLEAQKATGVAIEQRDYSALSALLPKQREAYLKIMGIEGRDQDDKAYRVARAMDLSRMLSSAENVQFLQDAGFPLGVENGQVINGSSHPSGGYDTFDAASSAPEPRNRWMRSVAVSLYWKNTYNNRVTGDDMRKIIENPDIDPVRLKGALLGKQGDISPVQLEAIVLADISAAVSDGWL